MVMDRTTQKKFIEQNIETVLSIVDRAAKRSARTSDQIRIVAVSKNHPVSVVQAGIEAGLTHLGENRVQEAKAKRQQISSVVEWHLVGHLQTNKVKTALDIFDLIHSVDRFRLLNRIQRLAILTDRKIEVLVQINTSAEPSKFGLKPNQILEFFDQVANLDRVQICGLMTIGKLSPNPEMSRSLFSQLRILMNQVSDQNYPNFQPKYLSMGMSNDFEVAIEEGANLIRVGTAIFGHRQPM